MLDLVKCTEVQNVPSPLHRDTIDDIGSRAARDQSAEELAEEGDNPLAGFLYSFQLLYSDRLERLGAGAARDGVRWVAALWYVISRAWQCLKRVLIMSCLIAS